MVLLAYDGPALVLTQTIALPDVEGRFDHFAIDPKRRRLFVAALGNNSLEVVDLTAGTRLQSIHGMSKPTGVLYLAGVNQVLVANGDDGTLKILNGTNFKVEQNLKGFDDADNLRYDPKGNLVWLGYADGALAVFDVTTAKVISQIKLRRHPESFQLEQGGTRLFVNIPEAKEVAVVDREKRAVISTWPLQNVNANFPMALDESTQRLYIGCRSPARIVVLDTAAGKTIADVPICGDTDDLFFDAGRKRLYAACGEGFIDIITQRGADNYKLMERITTRAGARTGFFSALLNQFYLAVPSRGNQAAELRVFSIGN